jgi:hypothetical protein
LAGVIGVLFAALLQPMAAPATAANSSTPNRVFDLLRRKGIPKKNNAARATPPPIGDIRRNGWTTALDAAVVSTVSVAVTDVVPKIASGAVTEQVGVSTAKNGLLVTAQVRATVPVKPLLGAIVIVEVPLAPAGARVTGVSVRVKFGAAMTVTEMVEMTAMPPPTGVPCTII